MKGFIIHPTYRVIDGKPKVFLYGRLENRESFLAQCDFRPYFYIKGEKLPETDINYSIKKSSFKNFRGEKVRQVLVDVPSDVPELRKLFSENSIECYEADIPFAYRFMIDSGIKGSLDLTGRYSKGEKVDRLYENPTIKPVVFQPNLKVLSIDIETNMKASRVFSISMYTSDFSQVLIVSDKKLKGAESFEDEKSMLQAFIRLVEDLDPDIITGWNVIDFDLDVLKKRCEHHGLKLILGRDDKPLNLRRNSSFFRDSQVTITGRMVLDAMHVIRSSFIKLDDYKLETAAKTLLGDEKLKVFNEANKGSEIERLFADEPQKLVDYNIKDSKLVYDILEKKGLVGLTVERSLLTGMQIDRVRAAIKTLDNLYLAETRKLGVVCPCAEFRETDERIRGGYVMESLPGIYKYIDVLDFKSLYPSIIRTFNIDPLKYVYTDTKENVIEAPNGAKFFTDDGILPVLIQTLWETRDKAKKDKNLVKSHAVKITMNSLFGVLANPNCRFYNLHVANAITHWGQYIVKTTAQLVEEKGHKVIYGDTDSIFIKAGESDSEARKAGEEVHIFINRHWDSFVKKQFNRKNFLELQFEKTYSRFLMPMIRGSERGSKKRYAGLMIKDGKEVVDITGLEFVRRDWTDLAKKFQYDLLDLIFHDKDVNSYVSGFIRDLRKGKFDDLLVYKKALRKNLDKYTKTTPPHVKAARLLPKIDSNIISYVMTVNGPQPVQAQKSEIDYLHYLEKQLRPIADSILVFYDSSFDDILKGSKQTSLSGF